MSDFEFIQQYNYDSGKYSLGPYPISDNAKQIQILISRSAWINKSANLDLSIEISLDAGNTWRHLAGFAGSPGGIVYDDDGSILTHTQIIVSLPKGLNRQVRCKATVQGGKANIRGILRLI